MADESDAPDWSSLPHDPQRFFGLQEGFGRKDLKRGYNRLIRRFKPETHPAEFQRIRAAYEQLDQEIRYGGGRPAYGASQQGPQETGWGETEAFEAGAQARRREPAGSSDGAPPARELHERVTDEPPAEIYKELNAKPEKLPYDYYALALLSDVCDRKDGLQFARWLIQGVREHPSDFALRHLLQAYLRGPIPAGALEKLLVATAQAIRHDGFYPVTEAAWEKLLRERPFETFVATLRKCESQLRDPRIEGRMVFTIRVLRSALWRASRAGADAGWVDEAMDFIESNFQHIPDDLEFEVDLLSHTAEYLKFREEFISGSDLMRAMDGALEQYFCSDPVEADRAFVEAQLRVAADPDALLAAFPATVEAPASVAFYTVWSWASEETLERNQESIEEIDYDLWSRRSLALLTQLEAKSDSSLTGQFWNFSGVVLQICKGAVYLAVFLLILFTGGWIIGGALSALSEDAAALAWTLSFVLGAVGSFFGAGWFNEKVLLERVFYPYCERMAKRCYQRLWRRDALDLLGRSQLPFMVLRDLIAQQACDAISTSYWVRNHFAQDFGLAIYSYAVRHRV